MLLNIHTYCILTIFICSPKIFHFLKTLTVSWGLIFGNNFSVLLLGLGIWNTHLHRCTSKLPLCFIPHGIISYQLICALKSILSKFKKKRKKRVDSALLPSLLPLLPSPTTASALRWGSEEALQAKAFGMANRWPNHVRQSRPWMKTRWGTERDN